MLGISLVTAKGPITREEGSTGLSGAPGVASTEITETGLPAVADSE
jgi:hypothetical protein